jgi:rhodanese-related sulfurtransferase
MEAEGTKITVEEAREAIAAEGAQAIDIRDKDAWLTGHVPGAVHAAGEQLDIRMADVPKDQRVIVVGEADDESVAVAESLRERGYDARAIEGGMQAWKDGGFTLQPSQDPDLSS